MWGRIVTPTQEKKSDKKQTSHTLNTVYTNHMSGRLEKQK